MFIGTGSWLRRVLRQFGERGRVALGAWRRTVRNGPSVGRFHVGPGRQLRSSEDRAGVDSAEVLRETAEHSNTRVRILSKRTSETVERIVEELMQCDLSKAERIKRLRELVRSGEDIPDELMDQALRRLMERITE
ncbi:MAG: hypothetical protein KDC98_24535 [Planctomycetes bacterium]|nr:hypothetical protein [Planctomycetota bacterium]